MQPQHIVQQGHEILGRRDTPEDRVENIVRMIGRTGRRLLAVARFQIEDWILRNSATTDRVRRQRGHWCFLPPPPRSFNSDNDRPAAVSTATIHDFATWVA
jgi:hypothetical protein